MRLPGGAGAQVRTGRGGHSLHSAPPAGEGAQAVDKKPARQPATPGALSLKPSLPTLPSLRPGSWGPRGRSGVPQVGGTLVCGPWERLSVAPGRYISPAAGPSARWPRQQGENNLPQHCRLVHGGGPTTHSAVNKCDKIADYRREPSTSGGRAGRGCAWEPTPPGRWTEHGARMKGS